MFKQTSLGQSSLQELLVPSPGSPRTLVGSPNGQNDAEHPSPILRWTSDGSMMEELMKALGTNPSTPTFGGGGGSLFKDGSITSSLQAAKEAAAAEQEAAEQEAAEENGKEQEQPQELQPSSGSGGASSVASQPFSFEALSGMAAQDRPLNSPDLGPLQGRGSSSSLAPSGTSCTLNLPPFSTGLQIPDQGLAFSGLLGSQQTFSQNGGEGSLMPGTSGGLRLEAAFRPPHSMSMLMSSGPIVSAAGGAMINLPPFSGQMGTEAWMGPGGSIPALRPGSTLTPEVPLGVHTTRLQASDGTVSMMPEITVWSPWAQQQQQQMPPPQPLGQEQGGHELQQQLLQQARLLEQVASSSAALQQGFNSLRSRSFEGPPAPQHQQLSSPRSRSFDGAGGRPEQSPGHAGLSQGGQQGSLGHSELDMSGANHSLAVILGLEQGRADSAPPTPTWAHREAEFGPLGPPADPHMPPQQQQQQQLDLLGSRSAPGSPAGGLHRQGPFGPVPGTHQQPPHHHQQQQQHQMGSLGGSRSAPSSPMEGVVQAQAASLQQPSRFFLEQARARHQQHMPAQALGGQAPGEGHQQMPLDHHYGQSSSMSMYHHQGSMLPLAEVHRQMQLPGDLMVPPMLPAQIGDALYMPPSTQLQAGSLVFASPAPGQAIQQYQVVYASTGPGQPPTPVLQPVPGSQAPVATKQLSPQQVMALQAQLALKDAEVAAAAAQLDASGAGQAFTPIPVGLTRLSAPATGSGDTGSQRAGDSGAPMSTTPMASQEGSPQGPFAGSGSGEGHWAGAHGREGPSAPEGSLTAKVLATAREAQANQQGLQMPHIPTLEPGLAGAKENQGQADLGCVSRPRHKRERSIRSAVPSVAPKRHSHGSGPAPLLEPVGSGASEGGEASKLGTATRSHSNPGEQAMLADMVDDRGQPLDAATWKALTRKEKNRQSAAASRARREAYTESLEAKVKKLHEQQDWLKAQYEKQNHLQDGIVRDPNAPIRPPVRHVSF